MGPFYKVTRNTSQRRKRILAEFRINVNLLLPPSFIERFVQIETWPRNGFERIKYSCKKIPACPSSRRITSDAREMLYDFFSSSSKLIVFSRRSKTLFLFAAMNSDLSTYCEKFIFAENVGQAELHACSCNWLIRDYKKEFPASNCVRGNQFISACKNWERKKLALLLSASVKSWCNTDCSEEISSESNHFARPFSWIRLSLFLLCMYIIAIPWPRL